MSCAGRHDEDLRRPERRLGARGRDEVHRHVERLSRRREGHEPDTVGAGPPCRPRPAAGVTAPAVRPGSARRAGVRAPPRQCAAIAASTVPSVAPGAAWCSWSSRSGRRWPRAPSRPPAARRRPDQGRRRPGSATFNVGCGVRGEADGGDAAHTARAEQCRTRSSRCAFHAVLLIPNPPCRAFRQHVESARQSPLALTHWRLS